MGCTLTISFHVFNFYFSLSIKDFNSKIMASTTFCGYVITSSPIRPCASSSRNDFSSHFFEGLTASCSPSTFLSSIAHMERKSHLPSSYFFWATFCSFGRGFGFHHHSFSLLCHLANNLFNNADCKTDMAHTHTLLHIFHMNPKL